MRFPSRLRKELQTSALTGSIMMCEQVRRTIDQRKVTSGHWILTKWSNKVAKLATLCVPSPLARNPGQEVCGGDDQVQRGPGWLPGQEQRTHFPAAGDQWADSREVPSLCVSPLQVSHLLLCVNHSGEGDDRRGAGRDAGGRKLSCLHSGSKSMPTLKFLHQRRPFISLLILRYTFPFLNPIFLPQWEKDSLLELKDCPLLTQ